MDDSADAISARQPLAVRLLGPVLALPLVIARSGSRSTSGRNRSAARSGFFGTLAFTLPTLVAFVLTRPLVESRIGP